MAGSQFKLRVGTELDTSGFAAQLKKNLKDQKIKVSLDIDSGSSGSSSKSKLQKRMRQNAKAVENEFKQALALQKQIAAGERQLSNGNLAKGLANNIRKEVAAARAELNKLYSDYGKKFSTSQRLALEKARGGTPGIQIGNTKDTYNQMLQQIRDIERESANMFKNDVGTAQFALAEQRIQKLKSAYNEFRNSVNGQLDLSQLNKLDTALNNIEKKMEQARAKMVDNQRKTANAFVDDIDNGKLVAQFDTLSERIDRLSFKTPELTKSFTELKKARDDFGNVSSRYRETGDVDSVIQAQKQYNRVLEATQNQLKSVEAQQRKMQRDYKNQDAIKSLETSKQTFDLQVQSWLKSNSAAAADFGDRLNDIRARIKDCNDSASLNNLKSEFQQVKLEAQIADKATMTFGDRLKNQLREYASYIGIAGVFMAGSQAVRMMAQNVLEVDTAMTGLYRVTDMTAAQYDKLYSDMIASSKEYGTTLTDTINATSDWVRAGYDADTALQLADITAMYQHISDLDYDEASKNLLTAYNGFKDSFNEEFGGDVVASVNHIADAFNDLDNKYSITSAGLGEGLARSASALQLAGNTFEEAAA